MISLFCSGGGKKLSIYVPGAWQEEKREKVLYIVFSPSETVKLLRIAGLSPAGVFPLFYNIILIYKKDLTERCQLLSFLITMIKERLDKLFNKYMTFIVLPHDEVGAKQKRVSYGALALTLFFIFLFGGIQKALKKQYFLQ